MSETVETQPAADSGTTPIPGFSVKPAPSHVRNGRELQIWQVTFARRNATFRKMGLGDAWDLMELSQGQTSGSWYNMASIAAAVTTIDGDPVPPRMGDTVSRAEIRWVLDKLGMDGLLAVAEGLKQIDPPTTTDTAAVAKNS